MQMGEADNHSPVQKEVLAMHPVTAPCNIDDGACVAIELSNVKWKQTRFVCSDIS